MSKNSSLVLFTVTIFAITMSFKWICDVNASVKQHHGAKSVNTDQAASRTTASPQAASSSLRAYGWSQFANFLHTHQAISFPDAAFQPDKDWEGLPTWRTKCQIGLLTGADCDIPGSQDTFSMNFPRPKFEKPVQLTLPPAVFDPSSPTGEVVLYNGAASRHIDPASSSGTPTATYPSQGGAAFPDGSIIVKEIWEVAQEGEPFTVFDRDSSFFAPPPSTPNPTANPEPVSVVLGAGGFIGMGAWRSKITISQASGSGCPLAHESLTLATAMGGSASVTVPASCFIQQTIGKNRYLLIGVNMIHKVGGAWRWTTGWWTYNPSGKTESPFNEDRPDYLKVWSHYDIDVTAGDDGRICFNPYLEGPGPNGNNTNCVHCHQYAATGILRHVGTKAGSTNASPPITSKALAKYMSHNHGIPTDSVWSLAKGPSTPPPGNH
jgi:hypothetical protein